MEKHCPYQKNGCYNWCARYDRIHSQCVDLTIADALTLLADQVYELDESSIKDKPSTRMFNRYRMDMEKKAAEMDSFFYPEKYAPDEEPN